MEQQAEREDDRMAGFKHVCSVWAAGQWSGNKQNLIVCRKNGPQWCRDEGERQAQRLFESQSESRKYFDRAQFPEKFPNQSQQC